MKNNKIFWWVIFVVCAIAIIFPLVFVFWLRLSNPDMTNYRFVMSFWKETLLSASIVISTIVVFMKKILK